MSIYNLPSSIPLNMKVRVPFSYTNPNGQVDTTTAMNLTTDNPAVATVAIDTADNRALWITPTGQGATSIRINPPTATPSPGQINLTVEAAANLSHVDPGPADPFVPQ